ncbi:carbon storage regulator CsrA [Fervidobacterium thailandense]|uniref:Translational regulator CsrA n=1 Tax=Fervidobacterium thailandense TaxID=1008305 RepID=A0A1E3G4T8_9BACT|nr:carbon storage regulator CsrA [Fervidobacterium thailandense]ODN31267.1 carbon storage regulator [Fervidobacterium thailandense]
MLVLSRKVGESIIIGDNVEIKILKVEGSSVKLGIVAPADVKIYREEVYKKVAEQNKSSTLFDAGQVSDIIKRVK